MLCEKCNKNYASTVITKTINGNTTTTHMCTECTFKEGYANIIGNFSLNHIMPDFAKTNYQQQKRCSKCNSTFQEILSNGTLGCNECYITFKNELLPTIENIHGKAYHIGKSPNKFSKKDNTVSLINEFNEKMNNAIEIQDFETAAAIRDELKKLEN